MNQINVDILVLGSGIAGLTFALKAANYGKVAVVTKKTDIESNTNYAQGGIAGVFGKDDDFDYHKEDTLEAGRGLCNEEAVALMVEKGPECIQMLVDFGANFTHDDKSAKFDLGKEGGHSRNRIVHAKDYTGREVEKILIKAARNHPNISIYENHAAIDLITEHQLDKENRPDKINCYGIYAFDSKSNVVKTFSSKITLIATGGAGQIYQHTTNPKIATGDGPAMAYRAGAVLGNLEFMQFHPTTLYHPEANSFLISEAVRGAGAILKNLSGEDFMGKYHPEKGLAPRDVVARSIDAEMKHNGEECVFLDLSPIGKDRIMEEFPQIYENCLKYKIDITEEPIPVVPAAHYMCGGIKTDLEGKTSINNLYACGEAAFTGVHGANRLASNSLLEALVFADLAAASAKELLQKENFPTIDIPAWDDSGTINMDEWILLSHDREGVQRLMWDYVGIVRSDFRLQRAGKRIEMILEEVEEFYKKTTITEDLVELRNISTVALMIINCAKSRKESRGLHYTTDFIEKDDASFKKDTILINDNLEN